MGFNKKTIRDIDIRNKKVIMRVDFNVPLDENRNITDDTRIKAALPTIKYILEQNAALILMSHLGRPKGKVKEELRLDPVAKRLSELLGKEVKKANDCIGEEVKKLADELKPGEVLLLENLRFHPEEEENNEEFAKQLASLAEIYVNDAFGTAHRAHASVAGIAKFLPAVAGFLMEKELKYLGGLMENPERPFYVVLGGAKISTKIGVINSLLEKVDGMLLGGGMIFTFFKAQGFNIGKSLLEEDQIETAKEILEKIKSSGKKLLLPVDVKVASEISDNADTETVKVENIPDDKIGVDIGEETIELYKKELSNAKTIFWNGPLGIFEIEKFAQGTLEIAKAIAEHPGTTVIGGGDSVAAVKKFGLEDKITHISTGGGASLKFLEGKKLPGVEALEDK